MSLLKLEPMFESNPMFRFQFFTIVNQTNTIGIENTTTLVNNMTINSSHIIITGDVIISGYSFLDNSSINIISSETLINGDLTLLNSSFTFSNSSIVVTGCIILSNNTHFSIDLSKYSKNSNTKITILKSETSCIEKGNISVLFINPTCELPSAEWYPDSFAVILVYEKCGSDGVKILNLFLFSILIYLI